MAFFSGDHTLDMNIAVARLTMSGESSSGNRATVVHNGSVGFSFTNMVDFNIYSSAFTSYNKSWSYGTHMHPPSNFALHLHSIKNGELVDCSFHDNLGTALIATKSDITLAKNNEFTHNQCACGLFIDVYIRMWYHSSQQQPDIHWKRYLLEE